MQLAPTTLLAAIAALAAVLVLILLMGRAARASGLGRHGGGQRLRVQDSLALDRTRRLLVVRCDGRDLLLLTDGSDAVIGWLPPPMGPEP